MKNLKKEFPILNQNTYLNTASSGILFDSLLAYRQEHDLDFMIGGSKFREHQDKFLFSVRESIGSFFKSNAENVVLIQNFSVGFNTILNGLEKNKKILLLDQDYPSINFAVTSKGFEVCYAKINTTLEQNIENSIQQNNPDIFAFSLVQYINGIAIDLDFLKRLKSENPNLLIIADGTQFCGTKNFDFSTSGIDILGASGYKWLLSGYGNGFFLFKNKLLNKITPSIYKENALKSIFDPSYTNLLARFQPGHLDTFNFGSLQHSLNFLSKIGLSNIEKSIQDLSEYAKSEFSKRNLLEEEILKRPNHSSIFNIHGDQELYNRLRKQNIITSLRGHGIRISFHFYNTRDDIETLLQNL